MEKEALRLGYTVRSAATLAAGCLVLACSSGKPGEQERTPSRFEGTGGELLTETFEPESFSTADLSGLPEGLSFDAADDPSTPAEEHGIDTVTQGIVDGTLTDIPPVQHGIVSLWAWVGTVEADGETVEVNEFRQICSGSLITGDLLLSARHCFEHEHVDYSLTFALLGSEARFVVDASHAPDGYDATLAEVHSAFPLLVLDPDYRRPVDAGDEGQLVVAMGYGTPRGDGDNPPSSICNSGTQGCLSDRRPLRHSFHTSQWDGVRNEAQLFVTPNDAGQVPIFGDSGGPLLRFENAPSVLDLPIVGVSSYLVQWDGVVHTYYEPIQNFGPWICQFANCPI